MIIIADITGRTRLYDEMLFSSMRDNHDAEVSLLMPGHGLLCLIPKRFQASSNPIKRIVKILECIINYFVLGFKLYASKARVLHIEWLPFLEISGVEYYILSIYKHLFSPLRIVLTVHNVFPHDLKESKKSAYINRFRRIGQYIDAMIVHTATSKKELCSIFNVDENRVHICPHGVFRPFIINESSKKSGLDKFVVLMFGLHSYYKGTDILVEAVNRLPDSYKSKVDVHIVGLVEADYYAQLKEMDSSHMIKWKNYFLSDKELGEEIAQCDLIVLPYRAISQSGVLLLSLNCRKMIVCSDLPSFKETLHGSDDNCSFDHDLFFKSDDSISLCSLLQNYIDRKVSEQRLLNRMEELAKDYSWEKSAEKTMEVYRRLVSYNG